MKGEILIWKTGEALPPIRARHGDFEEWIRKGLGGALPVRVRDPRRGEPPRDPSAFAGLVVTGSPANVTDDAPWIFGAAEGLAASVKKGVPVLGICFGHQLLAAALGGEAGFNPSGRNTGTLLYRPSPAAAEDPLLGALPDPFPAQASHAQRVLRLPPGAVLLASAETDPIAAFRIGRRAWGVQFHPEFDAAVTREYVEAYRKDLAAGGRDPDSLLDSVRETPEAAAILRRFARLAAGE